MIDFKVFKRIMITNIAAGVLLFIIPLIMVNIFCVLDWVMFGEFRFGLFFSNFTEMLSVFIRLEIVHMTFALLLATIAGFVLEKK